MTERDLAEALAHLHAALLGRGFAYARATVSGEEVVIDLGWPVKQVGWGQGSDLGFMTSARPQPQVREMTFPFHHRRPLEVLADVAALADDLRGDPSTTPFEALYPEPKA